MERLRISQFEYGGRRYLLAKPITVTAAFSDGLWVYSNESLNLWGYAERREDALRNLHECFDYLFREIAEEADDALDDVAKKLKQKLLGLGVTQDKGSIAHA